MMTPKALTTIAALLLAGTAMADVKFNGLYHNNTNLNATTEAIPHPDYATNAFLEVQYPSTNVAIYFLTESPAGGAGESVQAKVRLFSNKTEEQDAVFVTNITISDTNQFHATPTNGTYTMDLWRVNWAPVHGYSGTVFYAPAIVTRDGGGQQTDQQFLIRTIGTNVGSQWGVNDFFWNTNAQAIGDSPFGADYAFDWTNTIPLNFDYIYFNNPTNGQPQSENVPGLPGRKFLEWNYGSNDASYVHVTCPQGQFESMQVRFFFVGGPDEMIRSGSFLTNVVVSSTNQLHGQPVSGSVTLDVWQVAFYPPSGWSNSVFYAPQVTTKKDGTMWLVENLNGIGSGITATNNVTQFLFSESPFGRDWGFTPTAAITRVSLDRDYAYHNNTNLNPQAEQIPGAGGLNFLEVNYATTTTTFYVLTASPLNLIPGENVSLEIRISYTTNGVDYVTEFHPLTFDQNIFLTTNGTTFHGLPTVGSKQLDLWRYSWQQPTNSSGANTNAITVYYAPLLKTTAGTGNLQTDYTYLLANITAGPGFGFNSYPTNPQAYGPDNFSHDYFYVNQTDLSFADTDGDGIPNFWEQQYFGGATNATAGSDDDADQSSNIDEYISDTVPTNGASFFGVITNQPSGGIATLVVNPSSTGRVYGIYANTNLITTSTWSPVTTSVQGNGGSLSLTVTNDVTPYRYYRTGVRLP